MKKKYKYIIITLLILVSFGLGVQSSILSKQINTKTKVHFKNIGIVNQDIKQIYNKEEVKYSDYVVNYIQNNNNNKYNISIISQSKADQGINNNYYGAILKIPSNFTQNIISINNQKPQKASIYYQINENIDEINYLKIENDIEDFLSIINTSLNYIFTYGIFEGLHKSQEFVDDIKDNATVSEKYFQEVLEINLLDGHDYELEEKNTEDFPELDINQEITGMKDIYNEYQKNVTLNNDEYKETIFEYLKLNYSTAQLILDNFEESTNFLKKIQKNLIKLEEIYQTKEESLDYQKIYQKIYNMFKDKYNSNLELNKIIEKYDGIKSNTNDKYDISINEIKKDIENIKIITNNLKKELKDSDLEHNMQIILDYANNLNEIEKCYQDNEKNCQTNLNQKKLTAYMKQLICSYVKNLDNFLRRKIKISKFDRCFII